MTDNLRTRIAAAIRAVDDMRVCKLSDADIKFITDAVIRELNDQCGECSRRGDERDGCHCVYPKGHPSCDR